MLEKFVGGFLGCILALLLIGIIAFFSWLVVNFITSLICFCFGLEYTMMIGTGIWIIVMVIIGIAKWIKG